MGDSTLQIVTICIGIYAAIISTITLIWNIVNSILSKLSRFDVKVSFYDMIIGNGSMQPIKGPKNMNIVLVNKSNKIKYVQSVNIKLPYKTAFGTYCGLYKDKVKFPIRLNSEEELVLKYRFNSSSQWVFENYKNGKCRIFITDTTGKKYKSQKIKMSVLKGAFDFNVTIPSEAWNLIIDNDL